MILHAYFDGETLKSYSILSGVSYMIIAYIIDSDWRTCYVRLLSWSDWSLFQTTIGFLCRSTDANCFIILVASFIFTNNRVAYNTNLPIHNKVRKRDDGLCVNACTHSPHPFQNNPRVGMISTIVCVFLPTTRR